MHKSATLLLNGQRAQRRELSTKQEMPYMLVKGKSNLCLALNLTALHFRLLPAVDLWFPGPSTTKECAFTSCTHFHCARTASNLVNSCPPDSNLSNKTVKEICQNWE